MIDNKYSSFGSIKSRRVIKMTCCICNRYCEGRQWHNRDHGFTICGSCAASEKKKLTPKEMIQNYGKAGIHYKEMSAE